MKISRMGGLAAAVLMSAALLAGCGSSSDSAVSGDTAASTSTTEMVGGMTTCDASAIGTAVENTSTSGAPAVLAEPDSFGCADGWAYAFANVGEGENQFTSTLVFQAEGQFWVPKDRATVCTAPGNEVPEAIYKDACETN
jgi:hypothetical protein